MAAKYSIKDLERLSGIKAHTLRIWEQRYGLFSPQRTDTNIRWYSNNDLKKLLNITVLNNHGYKISRIAQLTEEEISREVMLLTETQAGENDQVSSLVIAMIEMDEARFEKVVSNNILRKGFDNTIQQVLFPFLQKIGLLWQTGAINPAQEHFVANLVRQKVIVAIDAQSLPSVPRAGNHLLFLPEGELHEIGLLYYAYMVRARGFRATYLGQTVPFDNLQRVYEILKPDTMITVITMPLEEEKVESYFARFAKAFPKVKLFVSGLQVAGFRKKLPSNITIFNTPQELAVLLDK